MRTQGRKKRVAGDKGARGTKEAGAFFLCRRVLSPPTSHRSHAARTLERPTGARCSGPERCARPLHCSSHFLSASHLLSGPDVMRPNRTRGEDRPLVRGDSAAVGIWGWQTSVAGWQTPKAGGALRATKLIDRRCALARKSSTFFFLFQACRAARSTSWRAAQRSPPPQHHPRAALSPP